MLERILDDPEIPLFMRFFATRQYNTMKLMSPQLKEYKDYPSISVTMAQKREATEILKELGLNQEYRWWSEGLDEEEAEASEDG
jgi:hypothetical protein